MVKAARQLLRRFGFIGAILFALVAATPVLASETCAQPAGVEQTQGQTGATIECEPGQCEDCGVICQHGCCHAPHVACPTVLPAVPTRLKADAAPSWFQDTGVRPGPVLSLDRPPRA